MTTRIVRFAYMAMMSVMAAAALSTAAMAATETKPNYIAFADHGGISDWRADGTRGLWVRSQNGNWYYATFMGSCTQLPWTFESLRFITGPAGELDRWSAIDVPHGGRCYFTDFRASDGPPLNDAQSAATAQVSKTAAK